MDRVFLDANVLFSAAYRSDSGLLRLWELAETEIITSAYALEEARVNLETREQLASLDRLARDLSIAPEPPEGVQLQPGLDLPPEDRPILLAAISSQATHLLTGDSMHFGRLYGRRIKGVLILRPAAYLRSRTRRRRG